jgi:glycerol-3-phosphate dehydrogenase subunit B
MALALELEKNREKLAFEITEHLYDAQAVGVPAICGIYRSAEVIADLKQKIGVPIFEIPTIPPGITGMRLKEAFAKHLPQFGVQTLYHQKVRRVIVDSHQTFIIEIGERNTETIVRADSILLASGRFIGQGLAADRQKIRETIFDLPVHQPNRRNQWHRHAFFDPRGHPANQAGIEIDSSFRPLNVNGRPAFTHLYAAGSILAHQDWIRMKCGSGLAISSAYRAVEAIYKRMSFK